MGVTATFRDGTRVIEVSCADDGTVTGDAVLVELVEREIARRPMVQPIPAWEVPARSPWGFAHIVTELGVSRGELQITGVPRVRSNAPRDLVY